MRYSIESVICPVCKEEAEEIFLDINNEVCGCDKCISSRDAFEWKSEQDDLEQDYYDEVRFSDK